MGMCLHVDPDGTDPYRIYQVSVNVPASTKSHLIEANVSKKVP